MVESALISKPLSFVCAAHACNTRKAKWRRTILGYILHGRTPILDYHFVCRVCFQEGDYQVDLF